ncbi:hypothetical protein Purlil1_13428 [Purpureocillium lilacinum]|uniref:Uncharacterized protein n=1 Tax=Purpureocillium lilacinum TaxID=33203 RepID=A0ABR0BEA0_PURLI|nr:hypothetical protein Purlil1_13428 [Purpureocillium lilacinum]
MAKMPCPPKCPEDGHRNRSGRSRLDLVLFPQFSTPARHALPSSAPTRKRRREADSADSKALVRRSPYDCLSDDSSSDDGSRRSPTPDPPNPPSRPTSDRWRPIRLRDSSTAERGERSANVYQTMEEGLERSLIHRDVSRPIRTWPAREVSEWYRTFDCNWRRPVHKQRWEDDSAGRAGLERFREETVKRQLERWSVRCPLCLLYRDTACHGHTLSLCPKSEGREARGLRGRLWEAIVDLQDRGLEGYGPVPWCGNCLLPKSACPAWANRDLPDAHADAGEDRTSQDQAVQDGSRCAFREVVVDALSAMMSFSGLPTDMAMGGKSFRAHVEAWRGSSAIRFNRHMGLEGWLLSPARWDEQDVAVMLRVFCHLDVGVEDMWLEKQVAQRRAALGVDVVRPSSPALPHGAGDDTDDWDPEEEQRLRIREALRHAEYENERASMSGGNSYFTLKLRRRLAAWHKGGAKCQLCLMYEWSEACYLHDMEGCQMRPEAQRARSLLKQWSDLRGAEGGAAECCPRCRFPLSVCRFLEDGAPVGGQRAGSAGACNWIGARVMLQTVASLLTAREGILGEAVIREVGREKDWNGRVEDLSRDWMAEQVVVTDGLTVPRIVEVFQRLLDGFGGLVGGCLAHSHTWQWKCSWRCPRRAGTKFNFGAFCWPKFIDLALAQKVPCVWDVQDRRKGGELALQPDPAYDEGVHALSGSLAANGAMVADWQARLPNRRYSARPGLAATTCFFWLGSLYLLCRWVVMRNRRTDGVSWLLVPSFPAVSGDEAAMRAEDGFERRDAGGVGPRSSGLSQRRQYTAPKSAADLSAWAAVPMRVARFFRLFERPDDTIDRAMSKEWLNGLRYYWLFGTTLKQPRSGTTAQHAFQSAGIGTHGQTNQGLPPKVAFTAQQALSAAALKSKLGRIETVAPRVRYGPLGAGGWGPIKRGGTPISCRLAGLSPPHSHTHTHTHQHVLFVRLDPDVCRLLSRRAATALIYLGTAACTHHYKVVILMRTTAEAKNRRARLYIDTKLNAPCKRRRGQRSMLTAGPSHVVDYPLRTTPAHEVGRNERDRTREYQEVDVSYPWGDAVDGEASQMGWLGNGCGGWDG